MLLHESQILSPVSIYALYTKASTLYIESCENYQKRSYRNRYFILGANGVIPLSVPLVKGKNQQTPITKVKIAYAEHWVSNHIHTITSAYGSAPYFHHYSSDIFQILNNRYNYLYDLNKTLLAHFVKILTLSLDIIETAEYKSNYSEICDLRNKFSIKRIAKDNKSPYYYNQVFEDRFGFVANLSILDALFCLGPATLTWLRDYANWLITNQDYDSNIK